MPTKPFVFSFFCKIELEWYAQLGNIVSSEDNQIIGTCSCSDITETVNIAVGGLLLCAVFLHHYVI
jgi:hypothetical protein